MENIIFSVICWLCSLIFWGIALWAFKRKDPMHFWSGSTVRPEEITDIPAYNRANGLMWAIFAAWQMAAGILGLFNIMAAAAMLALIFLPGFVVLIIGYNRIYNKYKSNSPLDPARASRPKTPKAVIVVFIVIISLSLIGMAGMFYYGEKDPGVRLLDDRVEIKAMYGLNIELSEMTGLSLIEKSMAEIGAGARTNGYGGFGGALKGHFKSETTGNALLFVQSKSSPTLRIERAGKKDVYISFRDEEGARRLYRELTDALAG